MNYTFSCLKYSGNSWRERQKTPDTDTPETDLPNDKDKLPETEEKKSADVDESKESDQLENVNTPKIPTV